MAIALIDFDGANTGGTEGLEVSANTPNDVSAETSPVPWSSKETFVYKIANIGSGGNESGFRTKSFTPGSDWITLGFYIQFQALTDGNFLEVPVTNRHFKLEWTSGGDLKLTDANNSLEATATGVFNTGQWYRIELKWERSNTGQFQLRINGDMVFDIASMDLLNAGATEIHFFFDNTSNPAFETNVFIGSYYVFSDDGANIDTEDTILGPYTVLGHFVSGLTGITPDIGDDLRSGFPWEDCEETPVNNTNRAIYELVAETDKEGMIRLNDGTTGGPKGNADVDGTIKAGKWVWRWQGTAPSFGLDTGFLGKYGREVNPSTDSTVYTARQQGVGSSVNFNVVELGNGSPSNVPSKDDFMQMGFKAENTFLVTRNILCREMWGMVLHKERRLVMVGGKVQRIA